MVNLQPPGLRRRTTRIMPHWDAAHQARRDQGEPVRRAIMLELRRRELAHEPAPTWGDLAVSLGMAEAGLRRHCRILADAELVTWDAGKPRTLRLTATGRDAIA